MFRFQGAPFSHLEQPAQGGKAFCSLADARCTNSSSELPLLAAEDDFDWARALRTITPPAPAASVGLLEGCLNWAGVQDGEWTAVWIHGSSI